MRSLVELISAALAIVSPVAFVIGLVTLVVQIIRKKSKKPGLKLMLQAVMMFALGAALYLWELSKVIGVVLALAAVLLVNQWIKKRKQTGENAEPPREPEPEAGPLDAIHADLNETVLIRSRLLGMGLFRKICILLAAAAGIVAFYQSYGWSVFEKIENWLDKDHPVHLWYDSFAQLMFENLPEAMTMSLGIALVPIVFYGLFWLFWGKNELVVTNRRVWGRVAFGRRVDLPLDMVSAVGISWFRGISVSSPSGGIRLLLVKNRDEIHTTLIRQLLSRRTGTLVEAPPASNPATQPPTPEKPEAQPEPATEFQTPPSPARRTAVPEAPKPKATADQPSVSGAAVPGRCMMCGKTDVPVRTVNFQVGNYMRKRTICEECAAKNAR